MLESLCSVSIKITAAFQLLPLQRSWAALTSDFNLKLSFVQSCSSQEQTIMCGHVNAGTNGNGCIQESGNHYVPAITGSHIVQFFPESEPQLERPLDSPDFAENKTWLIFWRFLMVVIPHPEPVPLLTVQWPHQSPTLLPFLFHSLVLATTFWCKTKSLSSVTVYFGNRWSARQHQTRGSTTVAPALWHSGMEVVFILVSKLEELNVHTQLCVV